MLDVDVGGEAAELLRLGDDVHGDGGLAGHLRPEDLGDTAARNAAGAQRDVQGQRACWYSLHHHARGRLAQTHDGAAAELLLYLTDRQLQGLETLIVAVGGHFNLRRHYRTPA